jgi:hypothetical protein
MIWQLLFSELALKDVIRLRLNIKILSYLDWLLLSKCLRLINFQLRLTHDHFISAGFLGMWIVI